MTFAVEKLALVLLLTVFCFAVKAQQTGAPFSMEKLSLTVSVSGESGFVRNLTAEDFEVYLENKRATVFSAKQGNEPASVGFLVDISASMRDSRSEKTNKVAYGVKGFYNFLSNANPANDYFVMSFAKDVNLLLDSSRDSWEFKTTLDSLAENELQEQETKLYEALKTAFEKIKNAEKRKKVLILVSDGHDFSSSKVKLNDIEKIVRENDLLLYVVRTLPDPYFKPSPQLILSLGKIPILERDYKRMQFEIEPFPATSPNVFLDSVRPLEYLSSASGGRSFYPMNQTEVSEVFEILADELKSQYLLEVNLPPGVKKGNTSDVKIKTPRLKDAKKVSVRTRKEIYF